MQIQTAFERYDRVDCLKRVNNAVFNKFLFHLEMRVVPNNKSMPGHLDILLRILLLSCNKFIAALVLVAPTKMMKIIFLHFILEEG